MKKLFFIISLCSLSSFAYAQSFTKGLKVGAGLGSANVEKVQNGWENDGITAGIHAGVFGRLKLGPLFVQPEAYYTFTKAVLSKEDLQGGSVPDRLELDFHRLDVPVIAGFRLSKLLRVNGGPFASFLIDTEAVSESSTVVARADEYYERAIWGWQAGLGLDFLRFTLDARYETTIGNLRDYNPENTSIHTYLPNEQQQQQFVVSLGYFLN
ncbi:porin family protein [Nafulsella turpanensis]|uniref:porin family protein n=1 Tax=Nafulsella turpanensis TaxID=1265690 RepID=UPI0003482988|nr:porin family protein [Nafulsella turpanensis]